MIEESIFSSISSQLWRYYDLEIDIHTIEPIGVKMSSIEIRKYCEFLIFGNTEHSRNVSHRIKCKVFEGKIEDLYLFDSSVFEYVDPRTTMEQQESR